MTLQQALTLKKELLALAERYDAFVTETNKRKPDLVGMEIVVNIKIDKEVKRKKA